MMSACILSRPAAASDCAVIESRAGLASLSGLRITSVEVRSDRPDLPGPASVFEPLHAASRETVIRRQLLFAAGDTIDSLRVGETLRRLRAQRLFSDAVLLAQRCDAANGVAITVQTRDTWTLRPTARLRANNQLSFGIEERNFLGTGRTVALTREMTFHGSGAAFTYTDPFLLGSSVAGNLRIANLAGGRTLRFGARRHEYSVLDPWKAEANFASVSFRDTAASEKGLQTISAMALTGRRIRSTHTSITMFLAGAEFDSATSISPSRRGVAAGMPHARSFLGVDLGLQHRTAVFDSVSWIVPGRGFLDVPLGWEGEGIVGGGYEREARSPTLKYDAWLGRVWLPRRGRVLMVDGWASSYVGRGVDRNRILRASLSWYAEAAAGMWGARLTAEQLDEIDPDRRGLSLMPVADYTAAAIRPYGARGRQSVAASLDRDAHVAHVGAASVVNVGGFVAASYRWNVRDVSSGEIGAGVIGARMRILSANGTVGSIRVDVGYPVLASEAVERKPFLTVTYGTLFDASRQRDGRRIY
ncbi:MAG: hypothetical protein ABIY52_11400 [Gemmatimonadaceae bacterium]